MNINKDLKKYIENDIIPKYQAFDRGHNIDHVNTVIEESLVLAQNLDVDLNMVYTIAAYHDLGLCRDRKLHHIISGEILFADVNLLKWFDKSEIQVMKEAVEDHRASSKNSPRTIYGRIVAEADRDIQPLKIIKRTIQYSLKNNPNSDKQEHYIHLVEHMQEKYSENGYMKLWFENTKNSANLEKLREIIRNENLLRELFEKFYEEEIIFV